MLTSIFILSLIGLCIALYSYSIERKVKKDYTYKATCDLSDMMSCTKPMRSPYAHIFYFSNGVTSILFYSVLIILSLLDYTTLLMGAISIGCIVSCYFAYILYFKIKTLCILCTALYCINAALLLLMIAHYTA